MENNQLSVSLPGQAKPVLVTIPEGARVLEIIEVIKSHAETRMGDATEIFLFLADGDEPLEGEKRLNECGVDYHHVHVHHCRTIDVTVAFGSDEKNRLFAPSVRVAKVKDWAVEAFAAPTEKTDYKLAEGHAQLDGGTHLRAIAHHCHLRLTLIPQELTIRYTVNAEAQVAHERHRTPRMILETADLDPAKHYLKHGPVSYKDTPDKPILLHEGEAFTAIYSGGGTVS